MLKRLIPAPYLPMAIAIGAAVLYSCAMAEPPQNSSAVVYRLRHDAQAVQPILGPGVIVAGDAPQDATGAERAYSTAIGEAAPVPVAGSGSVILAAGPTLDGPDQVLVMPGEWRDHRFEVEVRYTSANLSGKNLLRNLPWRPLAAVPLPGTLASGNYDVVVRWQPVESLPNGKPLAAPLETTAPFRVK